MTDETKPQFPPSNGVVSKKTDTLGTKNEIGKRPISSNSLKQIICKELETLVKDYVEYARNVIF